jgi:hypothetical protein
MWLVHDTCCWNGFARNMSSPSGEMLLTLTNHEDVCTDRNIEVFCTSLCEEIVSVGTRASISFPV